MKLRSNRGPKCCDDTVSATTRTENVTLTTVIIEPATADRSARAPSAPPPYVHRSQNGVAPAARSMATNTSASATAPAVNKDGKNQ
jgi:hypothetical protein